MLLASSEAGQSDAPPARPRPADWEPEDRCYAVDLPRGEAAWQRAAPFLELLGHEEHPQKDAWDGGMRDLQEAAIEGQLEGQYRYGITLFGFLYTDHAPEPRDRDSYVRALTYLRIAALRGHERAGRSLPGIGMPKLGKSTVLEAPLDSLPRQWVSDAFHAADFWMSCHGKDGSAPKDR